MTNLSITILALVSILLLTALVTFGVGHKRWSWVSVVGSFLVVFAISGYVYLAVRLLHFEWRWVQLARATQLKIHEVRDALRPSTDPEQPGRLERIDGVKSIEELRVERERWERAAERVENWRGRHWTQASFRPPSADGQPGTLVLPHSPTGKSGAEAAPGEGNPPVAEAGAGANGQAGAAGQAGAGAGAGADGQAGAAGQAGGEAEGDLEAGGATPRSAGLPIDPGATVYVFDDKPVKEGGLYVGAFLVQEVATDAATGRLTLTVEQTAPPDEYDRGAWNRGYDAVTVYDELPVDRWLAFSKVPVDAPPVTVEDQIAPSPAKHSDETLAELAVPQPFRDGVKGHAISARDAAERETVAKEDWPALREACDRGETLPGEVWAEVRFRGQVDLDEFLKLNELERDSIQEDDDNMSAEVEFFKAFELENERKAEIVKVFRRRRLIDAATIVHGSVVPGGAAAGDKDVMADGVPTLMRILKEDIAVLDAANERLAHSQQNVTAERAIVDGQVDELNADLRKWQLDVTTAQKLADAFEAEAKRAAERLETVEQAVVRLGRELNETVRTTVREIDEVAPPADRGAAAPAANF